MSGLIFVRNVHGTPLMPMSAAYARRLLRAERAHLLHIAPFTILQLAQAQPRRVLRPIVLQSLESSTNTTLVMIVHGRQRVRPMLRIIVPHTEWVRTATWADLLASVLLALRELAPISHLVFPDTASGLYRQAAWDRLCEHVACAGLIIVDPTAAADLLPDSTGATRRGATTEMVAWRCQRARHRNTNRLLAAPGLPIGALVATSPAAGVCVGVIAQWRSHQQAELLLPRLASNQQLCWRRVIVHRNELRLLCDDPVVFIPVIADVMGCER